MKKITIITFALLLGVVTIAQNDKYIAAMERGVAMISNDRQEVEKWQSAANYFERIANAESEKWLPQYYLAFCNMMMAQMYMEAQKEFEPYLDKAQASLDKALALAPEESEIHVLQGYVFMGRIWSNPMINGMKYGPKVAASCDKASELNPANPRPHYIKGVNTYYTPAFVGGGAKKALPILETAKEKYNAWKAPSALHPVWGKGSTEYFLEMVRKEGN